MQVDFEKAITKLTERWEEMTEGKKALYVEIIAYWPKGRGVEYIADISCLANSRHKTVTFRSFTEAAKWIVSEITFMIESEFYKQKNADKHKGEKAWKN
jgi:hypothetical protein